MISSSEQYLMPEIRCIAKRFLLAAMFIVACSSPIFAECVLRSEDATLAPGARKTIRMDDVSFHFRWCPPGEFLMGWPKEVLAQWDDEVRNSLDLYSIDGRDEYVCAHTVKLTRGFWILETEVTRRQYYIVTKEDPSHWGKVGDPGIGNEHPVHSVSWPDANRFCEKLTEKLNGEGLVRLPTEAEWEYACRAGTDQLRFDSLDHTSWHLENTTDGEASTGPRRVAGKKPNPWGVYDMLGNMAEWCADWYGPYPVDAVVDPVGPLSGTKRVVRGRSHEDTGTHPRKPMDMRWGFHAADRQAMVPDADWKQYNFRTVGFRVVLAAPRNRSGGDAE